MSEEEKTRGSRNRTLTLSSEECDSFRSDLVNLSGEASAESLIDKTIWGDTLQVLKFIPDEIADLVIIDPPYNLSKSFNGTKFGQMSEEKYENYLSLWFGEVVRLLKPSGSLYMCGDWKCTSAMQSVIADKLTILNRITWGREKGRGAKANWKNGMEDIWFAVKNEDDYFFNLEAVKIRRRVVAPYKVNGMPKDWNESADGNFRDTAPSNFWDDISVPFWSMPENTEHPTQKPEKLIAKLILASSELGDMVFDPFLGSGTTSVVAKKLGRHYLGVEKEFAYACLCEKRLKIASEDKSIQGYSDGIFWERNSSAKQKKADLL